MPRDNVQGVSVEVGDRRVTLGGVELRYTQPEARETIERLERMPGDGDIRILVSHRPGAVKLLSEDSRIDLVAVLPQSDSLDLFTGRPIF